MESGRKGKLRAGALLTLTMLLAIALAGGCSIASASSIDLILTTPEYQITRDESGLDVIQMEGFSSTLSPGDPMLAHKVYNSLTIERRLGIDLAVIKRILRRFV